VNTRDERVLVEIRRCSLFLVEKRTESGSGRAGGCFPSAVAVCSSLRRGLKGTIKYRVTFFQSSVAVCSSLRRGLKGLMQAVVPSATVQPLCCSLFLVEKRTERVLSKPGRHLSPGRCSLFLVEKRTESLPRAGAARYPGADVAVCSSLRRGLKVQLEPGNARPARRRKLQSVPR